MRTSTMEPVCWSVFGRRIQDPAFYTQPLSSPKAVAAVECWSWNHETAELRKNGSVNAASHALETNIGGKTWGLIRDKGEYTFRNGNAVWVVGNPTPASVVGAVGHDPVLVWKENKEE